MEETKYIFFFTLFEKVYKVLFNSYCKELLGMISEVIHLKQAENYQKITSMHIVHFYDNLFCLFIIDKSPVCYPDTTFKFQSAPSLIFNTRILLHFWFKTASQSYL